ncbi:MAG TPA: YkgJ family cysteine cluster protein [Methanotrichaceae archaeon]|nr:YkgJ family cysteine cluster protein [Methanotrichaceae archaeon]
MAEREKTAPIVSKQTSPWYRPGLRFQCQRCGRCCRSAGVVWLSEEEAEAMAATLALQLWRFRLDFLVEAEQGYFLRDRLNRDCVMLEEGACRAYPGRPIQCRTYPFWLEILKSSESWQEEGTRCPGIGRGRLWSFSEIRGIMGQV